MSGIAHGVRQPPMMNSCWRPRPLATFASVFARHAASRSSARHVRPETFVFLSLRDKSMDLAVRQLGGNSSAGEISQSIPACYLPCRRQRGSDAMPRPQLMDSYNRKRVHGSLGGAAPRVKAENVERRLLDLQNCRWQPRCEAYFGCQRPRNQQFAMDTCVA